MLKNPEGFKVKASKGEAVVNYCKSLATKDLKSSGFFSTFHILPPAHPAQRCAWVFSMSV